MSKQPRQNKGRGFVDRKLFEDPIDFIAGHPKAALLFWLFGNFRCDVLLFIFLLVIYQHINRYEQILNVRLADNHLYGKFLINWLSLVMSLMVFFVLFFFIRNVLDEMWD